MGAKLAYCAKRLEKAGFEVKKSRYGNGISAIKDNHEITCLCNPGDDDVISIRERRLNDHDDIMTDYFAGCYWDNISQALRYVAY